MIPDETLRQAAHPALPLPDRVVPFLLYYARLFLREVVLIFTLVGAARIILMLVPVWLGMIVDGLVAHHGVNDGVWQPIAWPFLLIVIVGFPLRGLLYRGMLTFRMDYEGKLVSRIRQDLFGHVLAHGPAYFHGRMAGSIAAKIQNVAETVKNFTFLLATDVFRPLLSYSVALIVMFRTYPMLGWIMAVWIVVFVSLSLRLSFRMRQLANRDAEANSQVGGYLTDVFANIGTILTFANNRHESEHAAQIFEEAREAQLAKDRRSMKVDYLQETGAVVLATGMMLGLLYGYMTGRATAGSFAIVIPLAMQVAESTRALVTRAVTVFENAGAIENGLEALLVPPVFPSSPDAALLAPFGNIRFDHVHFAYPAGGNVFKELTLNIESGGKIGLVGTSGAGKSTLIALLLRFYDVQQGKISIGGQAINGVAVQDLRDACAVIPQEPGLLHRTVLENIRYGRPQATDSDVMAAARKAHAHDFILGLPQGYETMVGERGAHLSGGQRQRIAIARAILKDAPILILDEATSALDSESEAAIQDSLETLMQGRTVIAIAHRLSTLRRMDRLVVLEAGRVAEEGTHDALLDRDGVYARLWRMQALGAI